MDNFVEDFKVFTPDHYMYIDEYEHPLDYIQRTYYETLKRIHLIQIEKKRHVKGKEADVQIDPHICICCRNHSGKLNQIKLQESLVKNLNHDSTQPNPPQQNQSRQSPIQQDSVLQGPSQQT